MKKIGTFAIKVILLISGIASFALIAQANIVSIGISAILAVILAAVLIKLPITANKVKPLFRLQYIVVSAVLNVIIGLHFYSVWIPSSKVQSLAGRFDMSGSVFLTILCILGIIAAFPFITCIIGALSELKSENTKLNEIDKFISQKRFYNLCVIISVFGILMQLICSFSLDIWTDEAFSLAMIKHGYREIVELTAADVHPPLYYFILKFFVDFVHMFAEGIPSVYLAKLVSVIPFILIFLLSVTKVRKIWGEYVAGMCAVCLVGMPNLIACGVEIRMYSWGLFFVFAAYLEFCNIIKDNKIKSWLSFVVYSLAAAYTHYFSLVSVALLYLAIYISQGKTKTTKKKLAIRFIETNYCVISNYNSRLFALA